MSSITKIWAGGRVVGEVAKGTFRKSVKSSTGFLHSPPAIALSVDSLNQAESVGASVIEVKDKETGRVYACTVTHFRTYAFDLQRGGYEAQKALPLSYWNVSGGTVTNTPAPMKSAETVTPAPEYSKPEAVQMSLFVGM